MGILLAAALGVSYLVGVRMVARRGRRWPVSRTAVFVVGTVALGAATSPALEALAQRRFSAHVVQHLVLGMAAPPLLALGAPVTLLLQSLPARRRAPLLAALRAPVARVALHPVVTWVVFVGSLFALYFSPLYRLSLRSELVHEAVHVHFLVAGAAWSWTVVGVDPAPHRLMHAARALSVALAIPPHALLGVVLMSSRDAWLAPAPGPSALADQRLGGGLLWLAGDAVVLGVLAVLVVQWARHDQRQARREDRLVAASPPGAGAGRAP